MDYTQYNIKGRLYNITPAVELMKKGKLDETLEYLTQVIGVDQATAKTIQIQLNKDINNEANCEKNITESKAESTKQGVRTVTEEQEPGKKMSLLEEEKKEKKIIIAGIAACSLFIIFICLVAFGGSSGTGGTSGTSYEDNSDDYDYEYSEDYTTSSADEAVPLALYSYLSSVGWAEYYDIDATTYATTVTEEQLKGNYNYYAEGYCTLYRKDGSDYHVCDFTMDIDTVHRNAYVKIEHLGGDSVSF